MVNPARGGRIRHLIGTPFRLIGMRPLHGVIAVCQGVLWTDSYFYLAVLALLPLTGSERARIPPIVQLGVLVGAVAVMPFGARLSRRHLVAALSGLLAAALAFGALVPTALGLWLSSFAIGVGTVATWIAINRINEAIDARALMRADREGTGAGPKEVGRVSALIYLVLFVALWIVRWAVILIAERAGWQPATYVLALATLAAGAVLFLLLPPEVAGRHRPSVLRLISEPWARASDRYVVLVCLVAFTVAATLGAFDGSQPAKLAAEGYFSAIGAFGAFFVLGGAVNWLGRRMIDERPAGAIVLSAAFCAVAWAVSLVAELAVEGSLWLVGNGVSHALLESGTTVLTVAAPVLVLYRYREHPHLATAASALAIVAKYSGQAAGTWLGSEGWLRAEWLGVAIVGTVAGGLATVFAVLWAARYRYRPRRARSRDAARARPRPVGRHERRPRPARPGGAAPTGTPAPAVGPEPAHRRPARVTRPEATPEAQLRRLLYLGQDATERLDKLSGRYRTAVTMAREHLERVAELTAYCRSDRHGVLWYCVSERDAAGQLTPYDAYRPARERQLVVLAMLPDATQGSGARAELPRLCVITILVEDLERPGGLLDGYEELVAAAKRRLGHGDKEATP